MEQQQLTMSESSSPLSGGRDAPETCPAAVEARVAFMTSALYAQR